MNAQLTIVEVTGSTNTDLLLAGKEGAPHGYALAARRQTAGRGRRGHSWDSTEGNLLLSIVLRPKVAPTQLSGLAAVCGLAALCELERLGLAHEIELKWPNDLVARGRKLGGILIESARDLQGDTFAVCGIGINVSYTPPEVPDAGFTAISLSDLNKTVPSVEDLTHAMHHAIMTAVNAWTRMLSALPQNTAPLTPILDDYRDHLCWVGREVIAHSPAGSVLGRGVFSTVDAQGRAVIENSEQTIAFHFEEASIRPVLEA